MAAKAQDIIVNGTRIKVTDKNYLAAGGQAAVFIIGGNKVVKLFHNPGDMIPRKKFDELAVIADPNVVRPLDIAHDVNGRPIGYTMRFLDNTNPLIKYFVPGFYKQHGITLDMRLKLVEDLRKHALAVHAAKILIVDFNELNVRVPASHVESFLIDTDSFQTPSYPATVIMESIRDFSSKQFTEGSDWYSWGVLAFQVLVSIHPFRGTHPKYKANEWMDRMKKGASVFDVGARVPTICTPFSALPPRLVGWFQETFANKSRTAPPDVAPAPSLVAPAPVQVPTTIVLVGGGGFVIDQVSSFTGDIVMRANVYGTEYTVTEKKVYATSHEVLTLKADQTCVPVTAKNAGQVYYWLIDRKAGKASILNASTQEQSQCGLPNDWFVRNNALYTRMGGQLIELSLIQLGQKTIVEKKQVGNVSEMTTTLFDGLAVQDLLGKTWISNPILPGRCKTLPVPELDGYRVVDAKAEANYAIFCCERAGKYDLKIMEFDSSYSSYTIRTIADVPFEQVNFTVNDKGLALLCYGGNTLEVFKGNTVHKFDNVPMDNTMTLFHNAGSVYFINGNSVHKITKK